MLILLFCYLAFINIAGFIIMGIDKKRAVRGAWRISERSLFLLAWLGGSLGCFLGMQYFRHKTKHWYFKLGIPIIFLLETIGLMLLLSALVYEKSA